MHYYKRNIGDYAKKAGRLTMLQHGAYTLLLDACYDREDFPTLEQAIQWTWASSEAEIEAVKFVLSRFFTLEENNKYVQLRILEEILTYHKTAETNKRIAIERETKRKQKSTVRDYFGTEHPHDVNEPPPNHKPLTINHKKDIPTPDGVSPQIWDDFLVHRKSKKAPITQTVVAQFKKEADQAGISLEDAIKETILRDWRGFKADWYQKSSDKPKHQSEMYAGAV